MFSTKRREPMISAALAERLYPYMGGIVRSEKGALYDINGIEDHVHMYVRWRTDEAVSELMRTLKGESSKWVHETFPEHRAFAWQEGYSVFSVSKSQEGSVKVYIAGQREHHAKEDFKTELLRMLRLHEIEFDERLRPQSAVGFANLVATSRRPFGTKDKNGHALKNPGTASGQADPAARQGKRVTCATSHRCSSEWL